MNEYLLKKLFDEFIEAEDGQTLIVCKGRKWALSDKNGHLLCPFEYDQITYIGENCFKAGVFEEPVSSLGMASYAGIGMTYAVLDNRGNILIDRDKGYTFLSKVRDGELTAAIAGPKGIIDLKGIVLMDFLYKYIQHLGEGLYSVSYFGQDDYYTTVIDRQGDVVIPASMKYRDVCDFYNHVARAYRGERWGLIDNHGNPITGFEYGFLKEWGEGYYKAEVGARRNILRPDGTLVLEDWYHDVSYVSNGRFTFGITIPKSKSNPKTRYLRGVAEVSGKILFPMVFDRIAPSPAEGTYYAEIGEKPYFLMPDGVIYDPVSDPLNLYPWNGVAFSNCRGCIFAPTIVGEGEGCDKLTKEEFRINYVKHHCPHHKRLGQKESEFEEKQRWDAEKAIDHAEKSSDIFAIRLIRSFVIERLGGDINLLRDFDLASLREDDKYGDNDLCRSNIVKSIVALAFREDWPELSVESITQCKYWPETICRFEPLMGSSVSDRYFLGLDRYGFSDALTARAAACARLTRSIGNLIVFPNRKASFDYIRSGWKFHGYMDAFLKAMYEVMKGGPEQDLDVKATLYQNRKQMSAYQGREGFGRLVRAMMLEDFVDEKGEPKTVFKGVWLNEEELDAATYREAIEEFIDFSTRFIQKRGERMIERLKQITGL